MLIDGVLREVTVFAATGLLFGGLDDLAVDLVYLGQRITLRGRRRGPELATLPPPRRRFAIFVPAWDEAAVIAPMLRRALARVADGDARLYVGVYPNDLRTADAVAEVALADRRVRLVVGTRAGPTTKADCLNSLWRALLADEAMGEARADAIVLHDAEDVVHQGELAAYDWGLDRADAVQLPVLPLPHRRGSLVAHTYLDEFAESHGKQLVVRQAVGAAVPLAGVGCAIGRAILDRIAAARGRAPFDAASLTEDYELGLLIAAHGGRTILANVRDGGERVAVRALFPATLDAAVRQKARWLTGIAFAGWDRTGWARAGALADHWMRLRDRRGPLAVLVLVAAYATLILYGVALAASLLGWSAPAPPTPALAAILAANGGLLLWRLGMRAVFTARSYGWREGLRSIPRVVVGNIVAMMAARRALFGYVRLLRGAPLTWDKTAHAYPVQADQGG